MDKKVKKICFCITVPLHQKIKIKAALEEKSMALWIVEAIEEKLKE